MRLVGVLFCASCIVGAASGLLFAVPDTANSEDGAVLASIQRMFDGMTKRDPQLIRNPFLPGASMTLMRNGTPHQMTVDAFADRVAKSGTSHIEERIHDPLVRIDHDLAMVWAPFEFLVDGKPDHCGTDVFILVRTDGKWLIASIADTSVNNCEVR